MATRDGILSKVYFEPGQQEAAYARMAGLIAAAVPNFQLAAGPPLSSVAGVNRP